jgi:hypothetical protein
LRFGLLVATEVSSASGVVPGAGLSATVELPRQVDVRLQVSDSLPSDEFYRQIPVRLRRGHVLVNGGWRNDWGRFAFSLEAGAALGWYRAEPTLSLPRAHSGQALTIGARAGARLRARLGHMMWVDLGLGALIFPRPPRILLTPDVGVSTPAVSTCVDLGAGVQF